MKFFVVFALLLAAVVAVMAAPKEVAPEGEFAPREIGTQEGNDAEAYGVSCIFGDWACSAHCRGEGRKGGKCEKGTCTCYN